MGGRAVAFANDAGRAGRCDRDEENQIVFILAEPWYCLGHAERAHDRRNCVPVTDDEHSLAGVLSPNQIRHIVRVPSTSVRKGSSRWVARYS